MRAALGIVTLAAVLGLAAAPAGAAAAKAKRTYYPAWIQSSFDDDGSVRPGLEVVAGAAGRTPVVLGSGEDVAPGSLAFAGTTV